MEKRSYSAKVKNYVRVNWFKLALLGMLVFVFLRKDLSFQFHLNNPTHLEELVPSEVEQMPTEAKQEKNEILTQQKSNPKKLPKSQTLLSSIELPFFNLNSAEGTPRAELPTVDQASRQSYTKRFGHVAVSESKKYGVPASIILANAILHSHYGQRNLTRTGNNHFGLPCTSGWQGESSNQNDACYRHYDNAWMSFRDHSLYLTSGRFTPLRDLSAGNYKAWAQGLEKLSYSDIYDDLAERMIQLIEKEELYGYDMR